MRFQSVFIIAKNQSLMRSSAFLSGYDITHDRGMYIVVNPGIVYSVPIQIVLIHVALGSVDNLNWDRVAVQDTPHRCSVYILYSRA